MKTKEEILEIINTRSVLNKEQVLNAMEVYATQYQEDNADKKYTEEDLHNLLRARRQLYSHTDENVLKVFINSLNKQD